jgi:hypothetical protein
MRRVILESPFAGDIEAYVAYARRCLRDCLARGEAPIASHLCTRRSWTTALPRSVRSVSPPVSAGCGWPRAMVAYIDYGISPGSRDESGGRTFAPD